MEYLILFLEGIITFISPCLLPMLPIYVSYLIGDMEDTAINIKGRALKNSIGFVFGFSVIFVILGTLAGGLGGISPNFTNSLNIVGGAILILFGLNYMDIIKIGFLRRTIKPNYKGSAVGFGKSIVFGMVFSIGWSPCVGTFLGSALVLAASTGTALKGSILLLVYSLGLGLPFIISALLIENLKSTFSFIKKHYKVINMISGIFLIIVGIGMMTGILNKILLFFV